MNIHIDILHPAHINLFKGIINNHYTEHNFIVTCIARGKIPQIAQEEINDVPIYIIGKHKGTILSIIFQANILRFFQLFFFLRKKNIEIGLSFGSFIAGFANRLKGIPYIHLSDDPERKLNAVLENLTCTERYLPPLVVPKGKVKTFNALKEWAYLSPKYFKPNEKILSKYNLLTKQYIFIREVSTGSLNYQGQEKHIIAEFSENLPPDLKVVLSLEDKTTNDQYPINWIRLEEPVEDIHSLIYYSCCVISSGDSMAREGSMLGVPSIYCGYREMAANNILISKELLFKLSPTNVPAFVNDLLTKKNELPAQIDYRNKLQKEWIDVNEFLYKIIINNDRKA